MYIYEKIKYLREKQGMSQQELAERVGYKTSSAVNKIELGKRDINQTKILLFAKALGVDPAELLLSDDITPIVSENNVEFPVIGEVAAGYDKIAIEDWAGDKIQVPQSYLKGKSKDDFFVLQVKGDSMYPLYIDGDKVLILKQNAVDYNGQVAVVIYNNDNGTIKKIEQRKNAVHLIPINPQYQPIELNGVEIEELHILGIPKLLIREIEE